MQALEDLSKSPVINSRTQKEEELRLLYLAELSCKLDKPEDAIKVELFQMILHKNNEGYIYCYSSNDSSSPLYPVTSLSFGELTLCMERGVKISINPENLNV